jgi:hypothetical protein
MELMERYLLDFLIVSLSIQNVMWTVIAIIAGIGLLLFSRAKESPVRVSLSLGLLAGSIAAGVYFFLGYPFDWLIIGKWTVAIVAIAVTQELLRWVRKRLFR